MLKLNKKEIVRLKIGDRVYAYRTNTIYDAILGVSEYILVNKEEDVYTFLDSRLFEKLSGRFMKYDYMPVFKDGIIKYNINGDNNICLMARHSDILEKDLEIGKSRIQDFLIENMENLNVEITTLGQIGEIADIIIYKMRNIIGNKTHCIVSLELDVIDGMIVTYDSEERKWNIEIKEVEFENIKDDHETCENAECECERGYDEFSVPVSPEFAKENMFNDEMLFKVEHELHDEIIQRVLSCKKQCEVMSDAVETYLEEDYHTYMEIMNILTSYALTDEIKDILENGKFRALKIR